MFYLHRNIECTPSLLLVHFIGCLLIKDDVIINSSALACGLVDETFDNVLRMLTLFLVVHVLL